MVAAVKVSGGRVGEECVYRLYPDQVEKNKIGKNVCGIEVERIHYPNRVPVSNEVYLWKVICYKSKNCHTNRETPRPYEVENHSP